MASSPLSNRPSARFHSPALLGAFVIPLVVAAFCQAQSSEVASRAAPSNPGTPASTATLNPTDAREVEYASLARDVATLGRELGLVKRVVKLVAPAVVHIEATPLPRYQGLLKVEEAGSGVIVQLGDRYYVLTNRHVIRHSTPERIEIHLADGRVVEPDQIWSDSHTDVAVMAITASNLVAARVGNSDALEIGDYVLAIGSPFGLSQSVTRGIISAKGRHNLDLGDAELLYQNFIQTDAAINPGNSGGPLVNMRGEIVGLNTAIASASGGNEGIGFTIPVNVVWRTARSLVETGGVPRGYLGVHLDSNFSEERAKGLGLPRPSGTRVSNVEDGSPAAIAGLRVNDVILEFNGIRIENDSQLVSLVKLTETGQGAELSIFRDGHPMRITVKIGSDAKVARAKN